VVAKLAERHGIRVRLTESPYGGTTAIVLLPGSIMAESDGEELPDASQLDSYRPAQLAGVGRHRLLSDERATRATVVTEQRELPGHNGHLAPASTPPALPTRPSVSRGEQSEPAEPTVAAGVEPAAPGRDTEARVTPSGLPWRQRRAATAVPSAAARTADGATQVGPAPAREAAAAPRDPDTARTKLSSYRSGTLRGRSDAARLVEGAAGTRDDATTGSVAGPVPVTPPALPESTLFPAQPGSGTPGSGGSDEHPQWASSTSDLPQWTPSTPRTTEEGG
jgi:hypothetical protein